MLLSAISKLRFDVLASYARSPLLARVGTEIEWFEVKGTPVIGVLIFDTDGEYSAAVLAPDLAHRYRGVHHTGFHGTAQLAVADLAATVSELLPLLEQERVQGDEPSKPVDFFTPVRPLKPLHPSFVQLNQSPGWAAARSVIDHLMRWYDDVDGNFVEQFQTTGFDPRVWELYLFATLTEAGYLIDRTAPMPDFVAYGRRGTFAVEATTVNPRVLDGQPEPEPPMDTEDARNRYVRDYMPIRFAGPLTAKLKKKYWDLDHVRGLPLVLAIQDFHEPRSMMWSGSSLPIYLYGMFHEAVHSEDGAVRVEPRPVTSHRWGPKEIASNFFALPDAENISAVIHNSSGTLSKFNRLGVSAGFGLPNVHLVHQGLAANHDPDAVMPTPFSTVVGEGYEEAWLAGMDVFHNPTAKHPLDFDAFPGAAHHILIPDGTINSTVPDWHPLSSLNAIVVAT